MKTETFTRLKAWLELFAKRPDVEVTAGPTFAMPAETPEGTPSEIAAFAKHSGFVEFAYKLRTRPNPERGDPDGYLFLAADGQPTDVFLPIGERDFEHAIEIECDRLGTGTAGFLLHEADPPFIAWSVEDPVTYPSLDAYLQAGARQGFCSVVGGGPWQRAAGKPNPLLAASVAKGTPPADLRRQLIARGASPDVADDLLEWLGNDTVLLLPK